MSYKEMNRLAAAVCGIIAFAVVIMIGMTSVESSASESAVTFYMD